MGKIIAVANQKGGVGKTTTTINLAAAIGEKDRKVLLVDLDSQSNATSGVGVDKNEVENSTYELLSGNASFEDCVVHTEFKNLDVLPSTPDLTAAEIELLDEDHRDSKLKDALEQIKGDYEFIIIDCPPSLNLLTVNALAASDSVLVPIQCEYYALEGLSQLLQTISLVKERLNNKLKIEGIVFTMYDPRVRLSGQVVANVKKNLDEKTFRTVIPRNVRLAEAPSHGKPVMYYTRFCSGTRAYRNLAKEIVAAYEAELSALEKEKIALAEQAATENVSHETPEEETAAAEVNTPETEVSEETAAEETATEETAVEETAVEETAAEEPSEEELEADKETETEAEAEEAETAAEEDAAEDAEKEEAAEEVAEPEETVSEETEEETESEKETSEEEPKAEAEEEAQEPETEETEVKEETEAEAEPEEADAEKESGSDSKNKAYEDLIAKAEREINAGI